MVCASLQNKGHRYCQKWVVSKMQPFWIGLPKVETLYIPMQTSHSTCISISQENVLFFCLIFHHQSIMDEMSVAPHCPPIWSVKRGHWKMHTLKLHKSRSSSKWKRNDLSLMLPPSRVESKNKIWIRSGLAKKACLKLCNL